METIKKFEHFNNNEVTKVPFNEALETYINGQIVDGFYEIRPLYFDNQYNEWRTYWTYMSGLKLKNGYYFCNYGGGMSGEDVNTSYIISPDNKIISSL